MSNEREKINEGMNIVMSCLYKYFGDSVFTDMSGLATEYENVEVAINSGNSSRIKASITQMSNLRSLIGNKQEFIKDTFIKLCQENPLL